MTDDKIITFESYYDPMLAQIVRTRLESAGIACFIADENTIGANPLYNQAVGGVKIKIFERDLEKCKAIMLEEGSLQEHDPFEIDNETHSIIFCPFCASTNIVKLSENIIKKEKQSMFGFLIDKLNPFFIPKNWHCNNCYQDFE